MKYFFLLMSYLPALSVGASSIILLCLSFDYKWMIIPCIINLTGFVYLLDNAENIASNMKQLFRVLGDTK